ncbi:MAG: hypothetical protein KatS3mg094_347 [Candidatus Parcubacteria bacterium]|nr:MAG: hypothetical protein KatS3mg094_347 [Candidatus Parcubacteria bacterium]
MKLKKFLNKLKNLTKFFIMIFIFFLFNIFLFNLTWANLTSQKFNLNWVPNGSINTIEVANDKVYIGGNFTYLGPYRGNGFILRTSQNTTFDLIDKIEGSVWTAIPYNNGWFIGGDFFKVGNCEVRKLAYIDQSGRVNCNFNLNIDDTVYALALKNNILFIGGAFQSVNNLTRKYLSAIDISDLNNPRLVNTFNFELEDYVFSLAVHPNTNTLYLGGQFIWIKNNLTNIISNKKFLAAINFSTNSTSTVNESFNSNNSFNDVIWTILLSPDSNILYVGGYFTSPKRYLAAVSSTNGSIITGFNPAGNSLDYVVLALEYNDFNTPNNPNDDYLYIGGRFATPSVYVAALNAINGSMINTFSSSLNRDNSDVDSVLSLALNKNNGILYVSGSFNATSASDRYYFRAINATSGNLITSISDLKLSDRVNVLKLDNNGNLFIGGRFYSYNGVYKKYLAAFDRNLNLITNFNIEPNNPVDVLLYNPNNNYLYIAGPFTKINNQDRIFFAAINTTNNTIINDFNYTFSTTTGDFISALTLDKINNKLFLCGYFSKINNENKYKYVAKINASSGTLDNNFINGNSGIVNDVVNDCVIDESTGVLYIGGRFNRVLNQNVSYLASIGATSSPILLAQSNINDLVNTISIDPEDNLLFVGGKFNKYLATLNKNNLSPVNLNYMEYPNLPVIKIKNDSQNNILFVSGFFDELYTRGQLGFLIATYTPSEINFTYDAIFPDFNIYSIAFSTSSRKLYLGGNFESISYGSINNYDFSNKNLVFFDYNPTGISNNPGVSVNPTSITVTEGGEGSSYNLRLTSAPTSNVIIRLTYNSSQIQTNTSTLVFTPTNWNINQTINVTAVNDSIAEGNHTVVISHSASSTDNNYNNIQISNVNVNIVDNDSNGVSVNPTSITVTEGGEGSSYNLRLTSAPTSNVIIRLTYNSSQIQTNTSTLVFTPTNWNINQTINVTAVNDSIAEGNHTVVISHSASSTDNNYNNIQISNVNVNIVDNDSNGVSVNPTSITVTEGGEGSSYNLRLTSAPTSNVIIRLTYNSSQIQTNTSTLVFTPTNWNINQTINVTAVNDSIAEGNHTVVISHSASSTDNNYNNIQISNVNVNIVDNDSNGVSVNPTSITVTEGGEGSSYNLRLTSAPTSNVIIRLTYNSSQIQTNTSTLVFTPTNWNINQTINVTAVNDSIAEGNHTVVISHSASSTDNNYNNIQISNVNVNIVDNDSSGVSVNPTSITVTEGGEGSSYNLRLTSAPTSNVIIRLTYNSSQIQTNTSTLVFTPTNWNINQTINVTAVNDSIAEGNHSVVISHSASSTDNNYNNIQISNVNVNIVDNDSSSSGGGGGGSSGGGGGSGGDGEDGETANQEQNNLLLLLNLLAQNLQTTTSSEEFEKTQEDNICIKYKDFDFDYIKSKIPSNFRFPLKKIRPGITNNNIKYLQIILNSNNKTLIAKTGPGSKNKEITKYNIRTINSVKKFQRLYLKVKKPTGIMGVNTIKEFNKILDCTFE